MRLYDEWKAETYFWRAQMQVHLSARHSYTCRGYPYVKSDPQTCLTSLLHGASDASVTHARVWYKSPFTS